MNKTSLYLFVALVHGLMSCSASKPIKSFHPGELWMDNKGVHINAHSGGMLFDKGKYYWFGEHKTEGENGNLANVGVHCYSSKDLYNWVDEGVVLAVEPEGSGSPIEKGCILERPKVIYNVKTNKYVMWFHLETKGTGYTAALSGVAVSDHITGPFKFIRAGRPNGGQMARDMNLFVDDDGKAYHIYASEDNSTLHIALLSDDYTEHTGIYTRNFIGRFMEAPAMFKKDGRYYLMMSGCTGWSPNQARSAVVDSVLGCWKELGDPCIGDTTRTTFHSQSTCIFPVQGKKGRFIYMGDRWRPQDAIDGRYVWLPVIFEGERFFLEWKDEWNLKELDKKQSLVPVQPSEAPDYFCTWSVQGYVVNYSGAENTRAMINEKSIFGTGQYENWISYFPKIRSDLYFVMDDSWDIPQGINTGSNEYLGLTELDQTRFPTFKGTPENRLKALTDKIKSHGWKGAGGWICAQESSMDENNTQPEKYWTNKLKQADYAGFDYWKVDWGRQDRNKEWREKLTTLGHKHAPQLYIEHAMVNDYIQFSDVFRTYDVESIISIPVTIQRIANLLPYHTQGQAKGIINCEDEPYIAVGLGCAIGIMRYPFVGALPNGEQDPVFPPTGRNLKKRMDEITRAVRWHRIAEPFGVNADEQIDATKLSDYWIMQEKESWINRPCGEKVAAEAPARISRRMPLPRITTSDTTHQPYILASRYPNGATAVVTIERVIGRENILNQESVSIELDDPSSPVGIFGDYKELILNYPQPLVEDGIKIYGQDLAGDTPVNITGLVNIKGNKIIIPGNLIRQVGLMAASEGDVSYPGMVLQVFK